MNKLLKIAALTGLTILNYPLITVAQIIPAADGTGTIVTPSPQRTNSQTSFDIWGGSRSADRTNLYHSFDQFNLNTGQTVNFISTPETRNILTRVRGGNISEIDGMIQVTGSNANLFLMNPAGIIFGSNASLNVPASFFATTSTAISLGEGFNGIPSSWFDAFTANNYSQLMGSPSGFVFSGNSGAIVNQGNLRVTKGETIGLVGNYVTNLGQVNAPNGKVNIQTIPGNGWVRISQVGNLLNLEVPTQVIQENPGLPIVALPKFLTGGTQEHATMVRVGENGKIQLTDSMRVAKSRDEILGPTRERLSLQPPANMQSYSESLNAVTSGARIASQSFESAQKDDRVYSLRQFPPPENLAVGSFAFPNTATAFSPIPPPPVHRIHSFPPELPNDPENRFFAPLPPIIKPMEIQGSAKSPSLRPPRPLYRGKVAEFESFAVESLDNSEIRLSTAPFSAGVGTVQDGQVYENLTTNYPVVRSLSSTNSQLPTKEVLTEASIREMLSQIEAQTHQKPAAIYAITHPEQLREQIEGVQLSAQSGLTLILVTPDGQRIVKSLPEVELNKLRRVAKEFYAEVSDPRTTGWPASRQLYQWLIAPLEIDLTEAGIDTLLFYLDEGLRSIPLAALYDGEKFLIESYNFSLIPSLSLTNASYEGLQNAEVLAMGMSEFVDRPTLPNVLTEILTITEELWPGEALLNQAFTLENLQKKRSQQGFKIIHVATHANFSDRDHSYIQFWDRKFPLKQLRDLEWYKQPQVELLVLSACETGLGNTPETEMGFAGLAHQAGVKSALASLWQVSDVGTLGLMISFYRNLKSGSIKAEALRQAQLELLHGEVEVEAGLLHSTRGDVSVLNTLALRLKTEDLSHPYYWAGFTMIGSPW